MGFEMKQKSETLMSKVNLAAKLAEIREHWRPKIVGNLNAQELKLESL